MTFRLGINYWPVNSAMYWWRHFDAAEVAQDFAHIRAAGFDTARLFRKPICAGCINGFACIMVGRNTEHARDHRFNRTSFRRDLFDTAGSVCRRTRLNLQGRAASGNYPPESSRPLLAQRPM